ncbi:MAG: GNAT family N-acetyltransferase [Dehalococcoidia bacterium]
MAKTEYPSEYETDAVLKDGSRILLRPIKKEDVGKWLSFMSRVAEYAKYLRLHGAPRELTEEEAARYCDVDYHSSFAFVAEAIRNQEKNIVAVGRYYRLLPRSSAEVAFLVEEPFQNKGIGTKLMEQLVHAARGNGITSFEAHVLAENEEMMEVFTNYGFHVDREFEYGGYRVSFPITRTPEVVEKEMERERQATRASLRAVLSPHSVAIIGASRQEGSIGQLLLQCIMESRFTGVVYPVNPAAESVLTVKAYPSVLNIEDEIELAIIAVPAPAVPKVVEECGQKGVRAIVIISDGFREVGDEGAEREQRVRDTALGYGMRVVGPNCMGVINTDPEVRLNGTFSRTYASSGSIAFLSQSGALGLAMLEYASRMNMGLSNFVSIGNRADISSNDLLDYWRDDEATRVILLYLESFGNPRKFGRIAQKVSARTPIVAIKGGRTSVGSRAAATHTGAMAASTTAIEALFRQSGIIPVNNLEESFQVVSLLANQPVPKGNRIAILTNGGGPGIMAADACASQGLTLPEFSSKVARQLRSVSKRDISMNNPLDLTASATEKEFKEALRILASDEANDAVVLISIPPIMVESRAIRDVVQQAASSFREQGKPLIACFVGQSEVCSSEEGPGIPVYTFPEEAISALAHAVNYGAWLTRPKGNVPQFSDLQRKKARKLVEKVMTSTSRRPFWLSMVEAGELLGYYGIRMVNTRFAGSADEAADRAADIGLPVAVKLASATIAHKTEVNGIVLNLKTKKAVKQAFRNIKERLSADNRQDEMDGVVVQGMVEEAVEVIAGMTENPTFGPLLMFGIGGIYTELLQDVSVRLHPLTDMEAMDMIDSLRMSALLKGWRGMPSRDVSALQDMLLRLSALVEDIEEITEIDFNPVMAMPEGGGYFVVDAKVRMK